MIKLEKFEDSEVEVEVIEEEKKTESKLYLLLVFLIFIAVTIGYAKLSSTLLSHGIGISKPKEEKWDVHFENISEKGNKVQLLEPASIDENKTSIDFAVNLLEIGSYYEIEADIKNDGTMNAKLDSLPVITGISTSQDAYTNYTVTYADGSNMEIADYIHVGESVRVKIRIELDKDVTAEQLPKTEQLLYLNVSFDYVQKDDD